MDPLVPTSAVEPFVEYAISPPGAARVAEAVEVASALVRSYVRSNITRVTGDVAVLDGTHGRRLVLGGRPVVAVTSVRLDGATLDPTGYTWSRSGALWRGAGWGGPDHQVQVVYDHGFTVVPRDLAAVTRLVAVRLASNPLMLLREEVEGESSVASTPTGFTVGELLVLDRYRRKTWP